MLNLYVTSPNKSDGKTFLTAGLAITMQSLGYSTCVYKPIQTGGIEINGFTQSPDLTFIKSLDPYLSTKFTYLFGANEEPLIASESENEIIDLDVINSDYKKIIKSCDCTLIDGDHGLMSPLAPNAQNCDLIKKLQIPVLFVITPQEDSINNTLLSIYAAQEKDVKIRGVVINNIGDACSKKFLTSITRVIEEYSNVNILGLLSHIEGKFAPEDLIMSILNGIDIESVFDVKIEKLDFN